MQADEWKDKVNDIEDRLEHKAIVELQKAEAYSKGYVQACEDFGREMRSAINAEQFKTDI